jgi:hypothetical protein
MRAPPMCRYHFASAAVKWTRALPTSHLLSRYVNTALERTTMQLRQAHGSRDQHAP